MTGPRDWDKELAAIDKAIERMPAGSAPAPTPASTKGASTAPTAPARRAEAPVARAGRPGTTWLRVILVLALAVAMPFWPYAHHCGINLYLYLGAAAFLVFAGVWGAVRSWYTRLGLAHVLSLLSVLWGAGLVANEVLPRVGYAARALAWTCS
ncbi:MAG TPA: hypothetical protein VFY20_13650 [Gemmatimonadales bacterium]|nr:hypothetical protein [Gemmatimonadales bacterium]